LWARVLRERPAGETRVLLVEFGQLGVLVVQGL
jgi:hypothetical protein